MSSVKKGLMVVGSGLLKLLCSEVITGETGGAVKKGQCRGLDVGIRKGKAMVL